MDRQLKPAVIPICLIDLFQIYWKDSVFQAAKISGTSQPSNNTSTAWVCKR